MKMKYKTKVRKDFGKLNRMLNELHKNPEMMELAKKFIVMHNGKIH